MTSSYHLPLAPYIIHYTTSRSKLDSINLAMKNMGKYTGAQDKRKYLQENLYSKVVDLCQRKQKTKMEEMEVFFFAKSRR